MSDGTSQDGAKVDLRAAMPLTAAQVADWRKRFGAKHVNDCIKAAMAGKRNRFYAVEAGHFLGAPFDLTERGAYVVSLSILSGEPFVAGILDPAGVVELCGVEAAHGAH